MRKKSSVSSKTAVIFGSLLVIVVFLIYQPWWLDFKFQLFNPVSKSGESLTSLQSENESLKSQIIQLKNFQNFLKSDNSNYLPAEVFSYYPFNFKNEIILNAGKNENIRNGAPVIYSGVLIGAVNAIFPDLSSVQTIFDSSWQSSVFIGQNAVSALLVGGNSPKLSLIPKNATINSGDLVYNADKRFPYGLPIATIRGVNISQNGIFKEASLDVGYNIDDLRMVSIANDYPQK
ncbi:MAG: rod shape-determining protein MreC [Patescibacteria group bacterium]|nr:rod shape-determining protein MreC [Patescibacteria group bacterium]